MNKRMLFMLYFHNNIDKIISVPLKSGPVKY